MTRVKDARELDEQLSELVDWERFGVHLGMSKSEVDIIDRDKPDIANKKLTLFDKCLKANPSLSWEDVTEALEKIKEITLANKVKLAKLSCTKVSVKETSLDQPAIVPVRVCSGIVRELAVLNKSFVAITENLKREIEIAFRNGSMTIKQIISRTTEEQAYIFSKDFWHVDNVYEFFEAIKPFYSFLDCYLIVCLASLNVSSTITVEADEYEKQVKSFKESTDVVNLCGVLEVYFPESLDEGTGVRLTVVVQRSWGTQKLWLVEELIRVLFGLEKKVSRCCQWFKVRPGSVVLDFLLPEHLIMFAIVQCVNKLEFLKLMGVIAIRVGTILVMKKAKNAKFSFQNSFIQACKCENIESIKFLLKFMQVDVNKTIESMFLKHKKTKSSPADPMIRQLIKLKLHFTAVANSFVTAIIENDMIELSSLLSCVYEQRPSIANMFSAVENKADFFTVAENFFNFLNVSFLVAIENISCQLCSDVTFELENYAEKIDNIKKTTSLYSLKSVWNKLQKPVTPQPPDTILACIVLSNEWRACSISIVEKLAQKILSLLRHLEELQWFKISPESSVLLIEFLLPECLIEQLIDYSKENLEFMKLLGIGILKVGDKSVFENNIDLFTFEKAFYEAKESNNADVLQILYDVQQDLLPSIKEEHFDENNNITFECDPDSTALMISSAQGNLQIVKFLLDNGGDPSIQTKTGAAALLYAVYRGDYTIAQLLLEHHPHLAEICDVNNVSSLHVVCTLGNAKILKLLIKNQKSNLNVRNSKGATPLFVACSGLDMSLVSLLMKANADPNIPNNDGTTPLSIATKANWLPIVQCLLKAHADPNLQDRFGITALFFAVRNNSFKNFRCLMDANADPCIETSSAFHLAAEAGFIKMVKEILKKTSPNVSLSNGKTPLFSACHGNQIDVVKLLIKAGANPNTLLQTDNGTITPLSRACTNANLKMIDLLLKAKADPNLHVYGKETFHPLIAAITINHPGIVDTLLKANADPNARSRHRFTPLMYACSNGNLEIVESLLKAKANPNIQAVDGSTPLVATITSSFMSRLVFNNRQTSKYYQIIDTLLKFGADPNIPDNKNTTPLLFAAEKGMTEIVARLLKEKTNPNIQNIPQGLTPMHAATAYKYLEIIKVLLKEKADPNILDYTNEMAPLHIACGPKGSLEMAQVILSCPNTDPNILDRTNETPLHFAAAVANPKILKCLIASNANPNIQNQEGATPLYVLCDDFEGTILRFLVESVNILLEANADPNVQTSQNMLAPLHLACCKGWLEIVKQFLKAKANPNIQTVDGSTPLLSMLQAEENIEEPPNQYVNATNMSMLQAEENVEEPPNQYEIVDDLLQAGADPNIANKKRCTPLHVAAHRGKADIVARLLKGKANPNVQILHLLVTPLHYACYSGYLEIVTILLKAKADPNVQNIVGDTPLVFMLSYKSSDDTEGLDDPPNQYEIVDVLLQAQADPNIANKKGYSPLLLAALYGKTTIVARLLKGKANPNIQNINGSTPLHDATILGHLEVIKILLKKNADPNIVHHTDKMAPLHIACEYERLETVQLLLHQSNADPNICDTIDNNTPLHYAVKNANLKIMSCLIESNANPNIQNGEGFTPLLILCSRQDASSSSAGLVEMVNMLLNANADPNVQTASELWAPLHYACRGFKGSLKIANSLLKATANPNIQDKDGFTPLLVLLNAEDKEPRNQYDLVNVLLKAGADPNISNKENYTPLFLAAGNGNTSIVVRLLKEKVNPNNPNTHGATPIHAATACNYLEIIKILLKEKADPNVHDNSNNRMAPLHIACGHQKSLEMTQAILGCSNTDPNILDAMRNTPLHNAVEHAARRILQCLIASNANPNIRNNESFTPLHVACIQACNAKSSVEFSTALEMVEILLEAEADPRMSCKYGTAFDIAIRGQNIRLLEMLRSHKNMLFS